jgi:phage terminase large subunit GpA-like protein
MDAGAEVANANRFNPETLPDGSQIEVSALQRYYNEVARIGSEAVAAEYDNDPPEEAGPIESGITPHRIQKQLSGHPRKVVPPECTVLTQGIDVRKVALHWVVRAWRPDGTGFTIDYGIHEVHGTRYGSDDGLDVAVKRAILARLEATHETEYLTASGQRMPVDLTLIDAGWRTTAVYSACAEAGLGVMPIMGFGKSAGCTQASFADVQRRSQDRRPGDGWFLSRKGKLWLVCADADRWKAWEHDRWMTAPGKPGCMTLFGVASERPDRLSADEKSHHSYARHICNEVEIEEPYQDTVRRRWKAKSENTHWLDASYYSDVAANMKGIRLAGAVVSKPTRAIPAAAAANIGPASRQRATLGQLARAAH